MMKLPMLLAATMSALLLFACGNGETRPTASSSGGASSIASGSSSSAGGITSSQGGGTLSDSSVATTGTVGSGGASSSSTNGASSSSSSGASSSSGGGGSLGKSAGCGTPATGDGQFHSVSTDAGGQGRSYYLMIPNNYDSTKAYPIVFKWHGSGGDGLSGGLGIEFYSGDNAIIVGGNGLNGVWDSNPNGVDVPYFDGVLAEVGAHYCLDLARVFSYGFSSGGGFTNLLACVRGNVVRANAPMEGFDPGGTCVGAVAAWIAHDLNDDTIPISEGISVRNRILAANGCSMNTVPTDPSPCVAYQGCDPKLPVVWCETMGKGHQPQADLAPPAVWTFFSTLP